MAEDFRSPQRTRTVIVAGALASLWFAMLTVGAGAADGGLLALGYAADRPLIAHVARAFTFLGEGPVLILIAAAAAAWMLWLGKPRYGMAILVITLGGRLFVLLQKYGIGRLRPEDQEHLVPVSSPSFPSAHAANSMIVFVTIVLFLSATMPQKRLIVVCAVALSLLVGLSRVILGVHYPSDVVGGWAFGLLWVLLVIPLAERLAAPRR